MEINIQINYIDFFYHLKKMTNLKMKINLNCPHCLLSQIQMPIFCHLTYIYNITVTNYYICKTVLPFCTLTQS